MLKFYSYCLKTVKKFKKRTSGFKKINIKMLKFYSYCLKNCIKLIFFRIKTLVNDINAEKN